MALPRDNRILARLIIASQFAPPFMFSGVAVALPAMGADLSAGATALGLVETLFLAGSASFLLPFGRLADATDKRTLFKLGLAGFGVSSILIGLLSSMPAILCLRFLQGAVSAAFAASGPALLAELVPAEQRGRAYGGSLGAVYAGLTLGPIAAGFLVNLWGWRAVFLVGAAVLLGGALMVHSMMPSGWRRPGKVVHLPSTVLLVAAVLCLIAGSATVRQGRVGYAFVAGGLALGVLFIAWQRRLEAPLIDIDALMRHALLRNALAVQGLLYMNAFSSIFMMSIYLQVSLGHPARVSGQVLAIGSVLMAIMAPLAGSLADRYRPRLISTLGVASVWVSAMMAVRLEAGSSLYFVALILAVQGIGFALFSSPNMTLIMNNVRPEASGLASALSAQSRSLGMVAGMLVTGLLISLQIGNDPVSQHPLRFIEVMVTAFSILAVLGAVALFVCFKTRERRTQAGL